MPPDETFQPAARLLKAAAWNWPDVCSDLKHDVSNSLKLFETQCLRGLRPRCFLCSVIRTLLPTVDIQSHWKHEMHLKPTLCLIALVLFASVARASDWTPSANPQPRLIFKEAKADAQAERYETAFAKHVWLYQNASKNKQVRSGVSVTQVLLSWQALGKKHPPALKKLRQIRDQLSVEILKGKVNQPAFIEFSLINQGLDENSKTTDTFKALAAKNKLAAKLVFHFAKHALLKDKEYSLYGKFVDPELEYRQICQSYDGLVRMGKNFSEGNPLTAVAAPSFQAQCLELVAVLSVTRRKKEAAQIAALAKKKIDSPKFHESLKAALNGTFPAPVTR